jgi:hypothetical protein
VASPSRSKLKTGVNISKSKEYLFNSCYRSKKFVRIWEFKNEEGIQEG